MRLRTKRWAASSVEVSPPELSSGASALERYPWRSSLLDSCPLSILVRPTRWYPDHPCWRESQREMPPGVAASCSSASNGILDSRQARMRRDGVGGGGQGCFVIEAEFFLLRRPMRPARGSRGWKSKSTVKASNLLSRISKTGPRARRSCGFATGCSGKFAVEGQRSRPRPLRARDSAGTRPTHRTTPAMCAGFSVGMARGQANSDCRSRF